MGNGGSLGAVYAGRFIAGLGVGQTVVVAPVYLAEIVSLLGICECAISTNFQNPGPCCHSWSMYLCLYRLRLSGHCPRILRKLWL